MYFINVTTRISLADKQVYSITTKLRKSSRALWRILIPDVFIDKNILLESNGVI